KGDRRHSGKGAGSRGGCRDVQDLRQAPGDVEAPRAVQKVVIRVLACNSEAVERSIARANTRRMHRRLGETHVKVGNRVGVAVRSDRDVLVRLRLIDGALGIDDLVLAEKLAGVETHDAAHDLRRNLLPLDRKSTRLNSSHLGTSYAVFCLKTKRRTTL